MGIKTTLAFSFTATVCIPVSVACTGKAIPLSEVPTIVMAAASEVVERIVIVEAERIGNDDVFAYELEGTVEGVECEIHVSPSGEVLRVEVEDD